MVTVGLVERLDVDINDTPQSLGQVNWPFAGALPRRARGADQDIARNSTLACLHLVPVKAEEALMPAHALSLTGYHTGETVP